MAHSILLRRDLSDPFPAAIWPEGIHLHPFTTDHAPAVHELLSTAYLDGGGSVAAFSEWWSSLSNDGEFDPSLVFVARNAEFQIVGVAQCWTSSYVKDLAVRRDYRRRGLGRALLLHAFAIFKQRGALSIGLKVHADNPSGAGRLYGALGMCEAAP